MNEENFEKRTENVVERELHVKGKIIALDVDVTDNLSAEKGIFVKNLKVGGNIHTDILQCFNVNARSIFARRGVDSYMLEAEKLICYGAVDCHSANIYSDIIAEEMYSYKENIHCGGSFYCRKGTKAHNIWVAKDYYSDNIHCNILEVEGSLSANRVICKKCIVKGDIFTDIIDSNGNDIYLGGVFQGTVIGGGKVHEFFSDWENII